MAKPLIHTTATDEYIQIWVLEAVKERFYLDAIRESKTNEMSATESNIRSRERLARLNTNRTYKARKAIKEVKIWSQQ